MTGSGAPTRWVLWEREGWRRPDERTADETVAAEAVPPALVASGAVVAPARVRPDAPVHAVIDRRSIGIVFQPVFDSTGRHTVGFEALARGPEGPLHAPRRLFAAARAVGRAGELDWICRAAAFRIVMDAGLHPSLSLFVNIEPDSLITPCPTDLLPVIREAETRLRVFIDVAGDGLRRNPVEVLESVRRARAAGWGVVLNDLEYSDAAVSLLPLLEPDVIRLDQSTVRQGGDRVGVALAAALTEAERAGTALLLDNVEEPPGSLVRAAGAGYLQGRLFGAEGPLPAAVPPPRAPVPLRVLRPTGSTPFAVVADSSALAVSDVSDESLDRLVRQFVTQAARAPDLPAVGVVTSVYRRTTRETAGQYRAALGNCPVSILVGEDMKVFEDWRTRAAEPPVGDPLRGELCFVALSAGHSSVVSARPTEVRDGRAVAWDVGMSHDPLVCRRVVRELLSHVDRLDG